MQRVRGVVVVVLVLMLAGTAAAQLQGGSVRGTVSDEQGGVLPGVTVTLAGDDAARSSVTDAAGTFRFLDLAPGRYKLQVTRSGFASFELETIVAVGKDTDVPLTLRLAGIVETVAVAAASPLDRRASGTTVNFTADELTRVPTSRDPFALLRSVPGVLIDRVNIGGNETGQAPNYASKGTRPQDAVWTLDGIVITDMVLTGAPPTYFNYDNFEEIQVSTAGPDIRQPTGGLGVNLIVKRGTNMFRGTVRGYFANDSLSASNLPRELADAGIAPADADHIKQASDYGGELGGPIVRDKAWFYASYSAQDIRLVRRSAAFGSIVDSTELKNPNLKINWQATGKDLVSFLYFDGFKVKRHRSPGTGGITFDAPTATFHQRNAYADNPLHGLWKIADDRTIGANLFLSAKYAYYNTGFVLEPEGGMSLNSGRDLTTATSYGSTSRSLNVRPQQIVNADASSFLTRGGLSHEIKYGAGFRRVTATTGTLYPGDGTLALKNSPTASFAQVLREGLGTNVADYLDVYVGDTVTLSRLTVDAGLKFNRQWGAALPSTTRANPAFPDLVPGLSFAGYASPFTWNTLSPRLGASYLLDRSGRTLVRGSFSRYAGQVGTGVIGFANPTSSAGSAVYGWNDINGNHLAEPNEVLTNQFVATAGGFNRANPTAVVSANRIDPNLKPPVTSSMVVGLDRELLPDITAQVSYSYTRTTDLFGNWTASITPRVGVTPGVEGDYTPGAGFTGALPDGTPYDVKTYIPSAAAVAAGGGGFLQATIPGYSTDYHGLELSVVKRLSNRWMGRASVAFNNAREHFDRADGRYDTNGNPTPTLNEPLVDGGQFAPTSGGSGGGNVFINAKWQFNLNAAYQAPLGIDLAADVFGRQGFPYPLFRAASAAALGSDSALLTLVTPAIDYFRYPNVWDCDVRAAREFRINAIRLRATLDVFNLLNANTVLVRANNAAASDFPIAQTLSPRVARIGIQIGF